MMEKPLSTEIVQSYFLTMSKYNLTLIEKRILTKIILLLQPLLNGEKIRGQIDKDLFGYSRFCLPYSFFEISSNYAKFRDAFFHLGRVEFYKVTDEVEEQIFLLSHIKIKKNTGQIEFEIHEDLIRLFLDYSKGFSKFQLNTMFSLSSVYGMRVYELICNQKAPITFKIDYLKNLYNVVEKYPNNGEFLRTVIKKAKEELDEKSPWTFDYKVGKRGRKFDIITFFPKYDASKDNQENVTRNLVKQISISSLISRELKEYLKNTCECTDNEIENNMGKLQGLEELLGVEVACDKVREVWARARQTKAPKTYLFGVIKKIVSSQEV